MCVFTVYSTKIAPRYISYWLTQFVFACVQCLLNLCLLPPLQMTVDHIVVAVGLQADTRLSTSSSGIEVDPDVGGYRVNSELQACTDVWVVSSLL